MIVVFVCLTDYSLQTVVIRLCLCLCRNFRDCFGGGLSFRNYEVQKNIKVKITLKKIHARQLILKNIHAMA